MTEAQHLALRVVEYALRHHSGRDITTTSIIQSAASDGSELLEIPRLCDFEGRAVYLDATVLPLCDVTALTRLPLNAGALVNAGLLGFSAPTFGVLLFDCERPSWRSPHSEIEAKSLPREWRARRSTHSKKTKFLSYGDVLRQPWTSTATPNAKVWCRMLFQAVQAGFISRDELKDEIRHGCARPSLQHQVDELIDDPRLLPRHVTRRDESFASPRIAYTHLKVMPLFSVGPDWRTIFAPLSKVLTPQ